MNVSCLFTFNLRKLAVCLHFGIIVSCLFILMMLTNVIFWCLQYILWMSADVCLHLSEFGIWTCCKMRHFRWFAATVRATMVPICSLSFLANTHGHICLVITHFILYLYSSKACGESRRILNVAHWITVWNRDLRKAKTEMPEMPS